MRRKLFYLLNQPIFFTTLFYTFLFIFFYNKVLFTPDFGQSDAYHLNFSLKYYLAENLKQNQLPFWTDKLMGGYPLFAEGQIGSLYIFNLLFLKLLPFNIAYVLLFIASLLLLTVGMYLILRDYKVNKWLSLLIAFNFTFSGVFILRIVHLNLLQSISLFPLLFFFIRRYMAKYDYKYFLASAFIIVQMFFTGHVQSIFISLFSIGLWLTGRQILMYHSMNSWQKFMLPFGRYALVITAGVLLALPQILPTLELSQVAVRSLDITFSQVTAFPFSIVNIINFFDPYYFGNVKTANYPLYSQDWGIFWENTPYIGEVVVILFFVSIITVVFKKYKINTSIWGYVLIIIFLLLLVLGKNSPLYFLFYYPPFSFFRTQSRFLIPIVFFMFMILARVSHLWLKKQPVRIIIFSLLILNFVKLCLFSYNYHQFIDYDEAIKPPASLSNVKSEEAVVSYGMNSAWNDILYNQGWQSQKDKEKYLFFRNFLYPNANLIYNQSNLGVNTPGLWPTRPYFFYTKLISSLREVDDKTVLSESAVNNLNLLNLRYLITSKPLETEIPFQTIAHVDYEGMKAYVNEFEVQNVDYYLPQNTYKVYYLEDINDNLMERTDFRQTALIENELSEFDNSTITTVSIDKIDDYLYEGSVNNTNSSLVVFDANYYPGWELRIDDKKSEIYKINLMHMGALVPEGNHTLKLNFIPHTFYRGLYISLATLILLLLPFSLKFFKRI